ncbi:hypothetical protein B0T18DRAFT_137191 [Schizothecium vesticola]|uniref:Uncharacterized protein n=1 Tax=Schizothecium vesticola TaxID=314040 RepID=A0AA40EUL9_9PEZI|nr:hypothetical protein B0T18DRAFT_137191 [Schizothecium vesticola]
MASSFGGAPNKITKHRGKMQVAMQAVKPAAGILKKLSHSEKNSLDLDRGWEQQSAQQLEHHQWGLAGQGQYGSRAGSAKDVGFAFAPSLVELDGGAGAGAGVGAGAAGGAGGGLGMGAMGALGSNSSSNTTTVVRTKFQHGRSASQASTGSTSRGAFVHPFQQTPRTSTPPLSYAASLASFDNARDYSPTITENDNDDDDLTHPPSLLHHPPPPTLSQSNLRRPSLASQRTSSLSDITSPPAAPLRVITGRTTPALARRGPGSLAAAASQSDLHLHLTLDSPIAGTSAAAVIAPSIKSPTSSLSAAPMSPLRSSLEAVGFPRLRSRSELEPIVRPADVREARRRFEERERAKEEKHDREMIRKRERRDNKQASKIERESRKSSVSEVDEHRHNPGKPKRPLASRKSGTPSSASATVSASSAGGSTTQGFWPGPNSSRDALRDELNEKQAAGAGFASRKYESVPDGQLSPPVFGPAPPPGVGDVRFEQARPRRSSNAKRKTQGMWQNFMLWLRTKILRMSGK